MTGGFLGSAMQAALLPFEETLTLEPTTKQRIGGYTTEVDADPVTFQGVIVEAEVWQQMITSGGVLSSAQPLLVVGADTLDSNGESVSTITKDAHVTNAAGVEYKVLRRAIEAERFGLLVYELTEEL